MNKLLIAGLILLSVTTSVFLQIRENKKGRINYQKFYEANLNGKIRSISINAGTVYFTLDNSIKYGFAPISSNLNGFKKFSQFAKRGDLIVKPSKSDTLKLIKDDKEYLFEFINIEK